MAIVKSNNPEAGGGGWLEASGLVHVLRTLGLAVQPSKLGLALAAVVLTIAWGTILDWVWTGASRGVEADAIARFVESRAAGQPYTEGVGPLGVYEVWLAHQRACVTGLLGSSVPALSVAAGTTVGTYVGAHARTSPLDNLANMVHGCWWLVRYHTIYALLLGVVGLMIWSLVGGAICRMAALQHAADERVTMRQAVGFVRERLFGGFFLAPCFPAIVVAVTLIALILGGGVLWIPVLGDLFGGLLFSLALLGGFVAALLLIGFAVGGSLLWPSIAVEGSDAFDAFSRSLAYTLSKPWKTLLYAVIAVVYAAVCWVVVNLFTFAALTVTRVAVSFGTAPFGWWGRGEQGDLPSKLERIWPMGGPTALYSPPDWSGLPWHEVISAGLIALHIMLVIGLLWSFLASFYFCGSTVVYFLLRRDVDRVSVEEVYRCEDGPDVGTEPASSTGGVSLPIAEEGGS